MTVIDENDKEVNWWCVLYNSRERVVKFLESRGIKVEVVRWERYYDGGRRILRIDGKDTERLSAVYHEMCHIENESHAATHDTNERLRKI